MTDIFNDYSWHSVSEPRETLPKRKKIRELVANAENLSHFRRISSEGSYLTHKSSKALWKFSEDGRTIRPVFQDEVLTEDKF